MRQTPELAAAQAQMAPGVITLDGFLGKDRRSLIEIIDEDENTVRRLGLTHEQIADRMETLQEAGMHGLGTPVNVDDDLEVRVDSIRGVLPCPWQGDGVFPKTNVFLRNTRTGEELAWTDLTLHMIREHGFYQGRGSHWRVEPEAAKRVLRL